MPLVNCMCMCLSKSHSVFERTRFTHFVFAITTITKNSVTVLMQVLFHTGSGTRKSLY
jgi:hypothetical protein